MKHTGTVVMVILTCFEFEGLTCTRS